MAAVNKYYTLNLKQHNPKVPQGREGFKRYFQGFFEDFPDVKTDIEHVVAENDKVMAIMTTRATNKKTGKSVMIRSADLFRIENCMIAEHWDVVDASGME